MKLDYSLINTITSSNKKEEAATILDGYFSDLEGRPVATPTKVRSFVAYPYAKEFTFGINDTIERVLSECNKSYNVNDYPFGFVFYEDGFGLQLIIPINHIELNSEAHSYTIYLDFGDEYIGKIIVSAIEDPDVGGIRLFVNDSVLLTPEYTEYQHPDFDSYESEEFINYFKQHIKECLIHEEMFPMILHRIEGDKHCWFIPYYANNNIESEDLTNLGYSKNQPFLPLVFNPENEYQIIQPEFPYYTHYE